MKRFYALLSGEHACMPHAELEAILEVEALRSRVLARFDGASVFEAELDHPSIVAERSGWIREVGELLSAGEADESWIIDTSRIITAELGPPRAIEYRRYKQYSPHIEDSRVKSKLRKIASPRGNYVMRVFITEGVAIIGKVLGRLDTRALHYRRPGKRPFFRPGPLMPQVTRAMINLARMKRGEIFLDPFCGTGGFPLEACIMGAGLCYCFDVNSTMIRGSRINLDHYHLSGRALSIAATATSMPLHEESVHSIATDPPYGRSTSLRGDYSRLVSQFLSEATRVVKPGSYIVFAGPIREEPWRLAADAGLKVVNRFHMHVHSTLVREIVVARKY